MQNFVKTFQQYIDGVNESFNHNLSSHTKFYNDVVKAIAKHDKYVDANDAVEGLMDIVNQIKANISGQITTPLILESTLLEGDFSGKTEYEEELFEGFDVQMLGVEGHTYYITINGHKYGYEPQQGMSMDDMANKFASIFKHNAGRALAWLKSNSKLVFGSKKTTNEGVVIEEVFEGIDTDFWKKWNEIEAAFRYNAMVTGEIKQLSAKRID